MQIENRTFAAIDEALTGARRALRRVLIALACLSCFSVTLGFAGVAMGLGEGAFLLFVTCASSIAGLALLRFADALAAEGEGDHD